MSVTVLLPATDETAVLEKTAEILESTLGKEMAEILVITSPRLTTQQTRDTIRAMQQVYGSRLHTFDQTTPGLGGAYRDGFAAAGCDYIILMASDLETDPHSAQHLLQAAREQKADVVACSRWICRAGFSRYNPVKYICNFLFQKLFQLLYRTGLTDLTFGYRIYRKDTAQGIRWEEQGFAFLLESLVKPLKLKKRVVEIPSAWNRRNEGVSHIPLSSYFHYFKTGFKTLFQKDDEILQKKKYGIKN